MIIKQVEEGVGGGVGRSEYFVDWIECHTQGHDDQIDVAASTS